MILVCYYILILPLLASLYPDSILFSARHSHSIKKADCSTSKWQGQAQSNCKGAKPPRMHAHLVPRPVPSPLHCLHRFRFFLDLHRFRFFHDLHRSFLLHPSTQCKKNTISNVFPLCLGIRLWRAENRMLSG